MCLLYVASVTDTITAECPLCPAVDTVNKLTMILSTGFPSTTRENNVSAILSSQPLSFAYAIYSFSVIDLLFNYWYSYTSWSTS